MIYILIRSSGGSVSPRSSDRASYKEQFASLEQHYNADQDGKNFALGFTGIMMAPLALELAPLALEGLSSASAGITSINIEASELALTQLNNLRFTLGAGTAMYFQNSNLQIYNSLMSWGNGVVKIPSGSEIVEWYNTYKDAQEIIEHYFH
jgi:hypothetical protein